MAQPKDKFSIAMDLELLGQIDEVAEDCAESRSAFIERIARNGVQDELRFLNQLENSVIPTVFETMTSSLAMMSKLAVLVGEELDEEHLETIAKNSEKLPEPGRQRQQAKRKKLSNGDRP